MLVPRLGCVGWAGFRRMYWQVVKGIAVCLDALPIRALG